MKLTFKNKIALGFIGLTMLLVWLPSLISAQTKKDFCVALTSLSSKIIEGITNKQASLAEKRMETLNKINEQRSNRDEALAEKRTKWDENRQEQFKKLEEKAQTDTQKQALSVFKETVTRAIQDRRSVIDAAIQVFRQGVSDTITSRKYSVDMATTNLSDSINAALNKAESDCQNSTDPTTVRQNLKIDLKAAQEKFLNDRQEIDKLQLQIEPLIEARNTAIKRAIEDFKVAMEKAKTDLKAAFLQESETSSTP